MALVSAMVFLSLYFSSCEKLVQTYKRLQDITHKQYFISKLVVITVTREVCLWIHLLYVALYFL